MAPTVAGSIPVSHPRISRVATPHLTADGSGVWLYLAADLLSELADLFIIPISGIESTPHARIR